MISPESQDSPPSLPSQLDDKNNKQNDFLECNQALASSIGDCSILL
jgi:hypothetical protein